MRRRRAGHCVTAPGAVFPPPPPRAMQIQHARTIVPKMPVLVASLLCLSPNPPQNNKNTQNAQTPGRPHAAAPGRHLLPPRTGCDDRVWLTFFLFFHPFFLFFSPRRQSTGLNTRIDIFYLPILLILAPGLLSVGDFWAAPLLHHGRYCPPPRADAHTVIQNYRGEDVSVSGGVLLSPSWRPHPSKPRTIVRTAGD